MSPRCEQGVGPCHADLATVVTGVTGSTVVITPAGVRTCGAVLICTGTATVAAFTGVGTVGSVATVWVTATVTLASVATLTLAARNSLTVCGTLLVGASQANGVYTGTFIATVNYQ